MMGSAGVHIKVIKFYTSRFVWFVTGLLYLYKAAFKKRKRKEMRPDWKKQIGLYSHTTCSSL